MTAPQGTFTFPGITGVISASATFAIGISPSVTSVTMPPNPSLTQLGTAVWAYGGSTIRSLPNSAVDEIRVSRSGGATTWIVSILDRRWMWEYGQISGEYNIQVDDNVLVSSEKTPRELAEICLEAMGETGYDITLVPADDRPYIKWEVEVPAKALAELLELFGMTVTLRLDNTVEVVALGTGEALPGSELVVEDTVQPAVVPSKLRVVTAPAQWQVDFETEAVGAEADGTLEPIADLSYAPIEGWEFLDYRDFEFITDKKENKASQETVRKWYRIKLPVDLDLPDATVDATELYQLLPVLDQSVGSRGDDESRTQIRAIAWGKFCDANMLGSNNTTEVITVDDYDETLDIDQSYSLNTELGVVQFADACLVNDPDPENRTTQPAVVFLRCQTNLRDLNTREPQRRFKEVDVDVTSPAPTKFVVREDVIPRYWKDGFGDWQDNLTAIDEQLDFYLTQEILNFQTLPGATADYAGFIQIGADGALRQVAYTIDASGLATTKITRNIERFELSLSFKESRKRQQEAVNRDLAKRDRKKRDPRLAPNYNGGN